MFFNPAFRAKLSGLVFVLTAGVSVVETLSLSVGTAPVFRPALTFDSGGVNASSAAVADLNGDGRPDVVTGNAVGGVGVLLGNGDGTFQNAVTYPPGSGAVAVADLNADGKPDVVATVWGQSMVAVLLGNGDGTLRPAVTYASGLTYTHAVAIADVNNDGQADLLVTDCDPRGCAPNGSGAVGVLLGNGNGTFQPVKTYAGGQPFSIAVGDLDADGKPDVVVANWAEGTVGVLIGNGDGSFQTMQTYDAGAVYPSSVVLADLNGDGRLDIAVASMVDTNSPGVPVGVLLGNGDGTFQPVVTYSSGGRERTALAVADVNGDGIPDLLVASGCLLNDFVCAESHVGLLLGNGDGTFQPAVLYESGGRFPQSISAVDVNGDGKRDLVVMNYGSGDFRGVVGVLLNAPAQVTIPPRADAYVQAGSFSAQNFGTAHTLLAKKGVADDNTRRSYLTFDLTAIGDDDSVTLRLNGRLSSAASHNVVTMVYAVPDVTWGERSVTWNSRPNLGKVLGSVVVEGTALQVVNLDLTKFVRSEKRAGRQVISVALRNVTHSSAISIFNSREASRGAPALIIVPLR